MVKNKTSIFEVDTGWFRGKDTKSYRIIANNKVHAMPEIIMIKNGKTTRLDDGKRNYDIILLTETGNIKGIKNICRHMNFNEHVFEDSIFCLPMVILDTYHYHNDKEKDSLIRAIRNFITKTKKQIS